MNWSKNISGNSRATNTPVESEFILAKHTGGVAPGCKFNVESTDVLLPFRPVAEKAIHPLRGWKLTQKAWLICAFCF
jgi:hypothetical protein